MPTPLRTRVAFLLLFTAAAAHAEVPSRPAPEGVALPAQPQLISAADPNQASATAGALLSTKTSASADGRYVVFESSSDNVVPGQVEANASLDVFLHDRSAHTTVLVSHAAGTPLTAADAGSMIPSISADGRWVVYWSFAGNLVAGQIETHLQEPNVFLYDRLSGENRLISHAAGAPLTTADSNSYDPAISADGRFIAFTSAASNLIAGQTDGGASASIFYWDRLADTMTLVTHAAGTDTTTANGLSFTPLPTADGSWLAFLSTASNLVPGQTEDAKRLDLFLWNRASGQTVIVNHAADSSTTVGNGAAGSPALSADGRFIVYQSAATNLVPNQVDPNQSAQDVFLYDRNTGANTLVSHIQGNALTTGNVTSLYPTISADGRFVSYQSAAANLSSTSDVNNAEDVFLWDRTTDSSQLLTRNPGGSAANAKSFGSRLAADGNTVVFSTYATDLVPGQNSPSSGDVFLYDRLLGTLQLMSHRPGSASLGGDGQSFLPLPSADGSVVVFNTQASNLVPQDTNGSADVLFYERASSVLTAASAVAGGTASLTANGNSGNGRASADGRFIVFASDATNLLPGQSDTNNANDIFLRDRQTGALALVSHAAGAAAQTGDSNSYAPAISADGRWISYSSRATNLVDGVLDTNGVADVFLYDRESNTSRLLSRNSLVPTLAADDYSETAVVSPDGRFVVFASDATDLVTAQSDANNGRDVFLFDRQSGSTRLVSHASGAALLTASDYSFAPSISSNGNFVAFYSAALNLAPGQDNNLNSVQHLFLYDRNADSCRLVDAQSDTPARTSDGNTGSTVADDPAIFSADDRTLAFVSSSTNLVPGQSDTNGRDDVFLFDRVSGQTTLVSHAAASATATGDGYAYSPTVSAEARFVAYRSAATNLVAGQVDANSFQDVFLWDRLNGQTRLVSHALGQPATAGNGFSFDSPRTGTPTLSPDGRFVAFVSSSSDLVAGQNDRFGFSGDLFLYETSSGQNILVSHPYDRATGGGNSGSGDSEHVGGPVWSADNALLIFASRASDLIAQDHNNREDVFALAVGPVARVVSRRQHGAGGPFFDVDLPLNGAPGIECRAGGNYSLVFQFRGPVTTGAAAITAGTGAIAGTSTDGSSVTVNLTGVSSPQLVRVKLADVNDGLARADVQVTMAVVLGDTNADGTTNSGDAQQTRGRSGQLVEGENFRSDVNADGTINSGDAFIVRAHSGEGISATASNARK